MGRRSLLRYAFAVVFLFAVVEPRRPKYRVTMKMYPKDTEFWATDFFVRGCKTFLEKCPHNYKSQHICARNYNDDFRNFANYCEMQYENCNSWRNWFVYKRERC